MRIRRVTYDLGNVIERQEYLDGRYGAPGEKRAKKKKATPEEVEQVNQWTRERKARHRLRMYFKVNDYFFTLTYPKEERPADMKQAVKDIARKNTGNVARNSGGSGILNARRLATGMFM